MGNAVLTVYFTNIIQTKLNKKKLKEHDVCDDFYDSYK